MSSHFVVLAAVLTDIAFSQCKWELEDVTINLNPLSGVELTASRDGSDDFNSTFYFSPCRNGVTCGNNIMAAEIDAYGNCYHIGSWDATLDPISANVADQIYGFYYPNGATDCGSPARSWAPTFECDPTVEAQMSEVREYHTCAYSTTISTRYACQNWSTSTTAEPQNTCEWAVGDNVLNLTSIRGFTLNAISDNDPSQIYSLTPCASQLECTDSNGQSTQGMATVGTVGQCLQVVARWDGGITAPGYSNNFGGEWQFVYTNGDGCSTGNGPASVVSVFWNCNPLAGPARITAAKEVGLCAFEIQIESNLACF